jgi:hypothetical protein
MNGAGVSVFFFFKKLNLKSRTKQRHHTTHWLPRSMASAETVSRHASMHPRRSPVAKHHVATQLPLKGGDSGIKV